MSELISLLVARNKIPDCTAHLLTKFASRWNCCTYSAIISCQVLSESELADFIAGALHLDRLNFFEPDCQSDKALLRLTYKEASNHAILPLKDSARHPGKQRLAVADPTQTAIVELAWRLFGPDHVYSISERSKISMTIEKATPLGLQLNAAT